MRPATFEYHRATSLEHALQLLGEFGEEARPIAGGQSLVPMMNFRLARPGHLVDINRLPLNAIEIVGSMLRIGALTRHGAYFDHPLIARHFPAFLDAVHYIGHPTIRRNGSIGGSISHADPTAELPAVAVLHDADIVVRSAAEERRIKASEFFVSAYVTALEPGEMVVAVEFPIPPAASAGSFVEMSERSGDFATASVGIVLEHEGGRIAKAAMVCSGAGLVPIRAPDVESHLLNRALNDPHAEEAGRIFAASIDPVDDHIASAAYRRSLIAELTRRAIETACSRALGRS
ncbi:xanthine dehydrogenase family protein subunit M [Pseudaminobacter sp. 19-2017]|uniref:Xanthine dehydrogenase family protein subunit M n=1 Tax=Pseudaminobacter soli (ex Zhang et al. 2022) TaxID=2831468 RepID=A0A942I3X3_9HYPH|nr:xanthine dehydrogenase family protein subunit M [Pseudaminobacter soli]MBS3650569.1 xanthine dehydrogenase family protein subunit M [Pseudaminobacter soli]